MYFLIGYLLFCVLSIVFGFTFLHEDSAWNKKRFDSKVWNIGFVCRILHIEEFNFEYKGFQFGVRTEDEKHNENIQGYSPYSVTNIYINDELVCKIHKLKDVFKSYRFIEYTQDRKAGEVRDIILKAYKASKKKEYEHYDNNIKEKDSKTFYK